MTATTTCLTGIFLAWLIACRRETPTLRHAPRRRSPTDTAIAPDLGRPEIGSSNAPSDRSVSGQRKHRELAAERCVVLQGSIATNGAQAGGGVRQPGGKTDTCPAADAGQNRDVLLATMLVGGDVSNDAGRCLELVEFLAGLGIDGLEVAFERSIEHHAAGGRQGTRPDRELLRHRPDDLA